MHNHASGEASVPLGIVALSPRERQVLALTADGMTNDEMALHLSVSVHAVKFHLAAVYRKLHVANRTEAAILYLRHQLDPAQQRSINKE